MTPLDSNSQRAEKNQSLPSQRMDDVICTIQPSLLYLIPTLIDAMKISVSLHQEVCPWLSHLSGILQNFPHYQLPKLADLRVGDIAKILNLLLKQPSFSNLQTGLGQPLHFVPQNELPSDMAYESFIAKTGGIPTRDNLHDWFNACIWLTFPKTKALLNQKQYQCIQQAGIGDTRGKIRDAITIFDENGAVLVTSQSNIAESLKRFDWQGCLVDCRMQWDNPNHPSPHAKAAVYVFGHALLEQLEQPRKPLCAHTVILLVDGDFFSLTMTEKMQRLDSMLHCYLQVFLQNPDAKPRDFSPLPILGVPYFWKENANPSFYQDDFVFRRGRRQHSKNQDKNKTDNDRPAK